MYQVTLKRSQWDCYVDTPDIIIATINGYFSRVLDDCLDAVTAQDRIYKFMELYKEWGFSDSECNQAATDEINRYYKTRIDRWASIELKNVSTFVTKLGLS